jgi:predicted nuclease of predicted toxin-antitoxin system
LHWIWEYALTNDAVVISKDSDFPDLVSLRLGAPTIIWVRLGNTRKQVLLEWFASRLAEVLRLIEGGTKVIELR